MIASHFSNTCDVFLVMSLTINPHLFNLQHCAPHQTFPLKSITFLVEIFPGLEVKTYSKVCVIFLGEEQSDKGNSSSGGCLRVSYSQQFCTWKEQWILILNFFVTKMIEICM